MSSSEFTGKVVVLLVVGGFLYMLNPIVGYVYNAAVLAWVIC